MRIRQEKAFEEYNTTFDRSVVSQWEDMIEAWNADPDQPDPYEEPVKSISTATMKLELAKEEEKEASQGLLPEHEVTPGVFLQVGLELEDQQRALRSRTASGTSILELAGLQEKRNMLSRRIQNWQSIQDVHMPMVAPLRNADLSSATDLAASPPAPPKAEDIKLWLPSALPPQLATADALRGLQEKERRLRLAQLSDSLEEIRRSRRILAGISDYTRKNVVGTGQRAVLRMRGLCSNFEKKQGRSVARYRAARSALSVLDPQGSWADTYKVLQDSDLHGPRSDDPTESFGRYAVSWIWLTPRTRPNDTADSHDTTTPERAEEFQVSMRLEWAQAKARAERWRENEQLVIEEMRRVIEFCGDRATWWRSQKGRRFNIDTTLQQGLSIYAEKQAAVCENLATRCASFWVDYLKSLGPLPSWILPYQTAARRVRPRRFKSALREVAADLSEEDHASEGKAMDEHGSEE
ncbi:hypothetical protein BD311DRAFT_677927 [Dichomitus squalens]|uniref:Uncharacterized protein n=1 Tax=Dichomitus squalens TaxID=114155 RepID=A0A4Q9M7L7_9APHY|nr:hypothetical protein BD311DRAFT_677927 [Dichomitus squalens]